MSIERLHYDEGDGTADMKEYIVVDHSGKTALLTVPAFFTWEHIHELLDGQYTVAVQAC